MNLRRFIKWSLWSVALLLAVIAACNAWLLNANSARIFRAASAVPQHDVALVLGTSPRAVGGGANPFFAGRMDTAAQLWREKKVRHFIVSGDNSRNDYNEPRAMRDALVKLGVPASAITLDFAGLRTLDSMVRAKEIFGASSLIVVTDDWHLPRALFLAEAAGVDAVGACSRDVAWTISKMTRVRECLSRVKAVADIYVLRTKPRFLGERVALPL
jgi:SanA protein